MAEVTVTKYNPEVLILSGLQGSGKTTEAKEWVERQPNKRTRISWDDLRMEMFGENWKWNRAEEEQMQARSFQLFHDAMRLGMSVVIDNTNLTPKARQRWKDLAAPYGVSVAEREIDTDIWTCIERDGKRTGRARVGRAVIERAALFNGFIDWKDRKAYSYNGFVICDLDGTLCDIEHRRKFLSGLPYCRDCRIQFKEPTVTVCSKCGAAAKPRKDWAGFFANVASDKLNAPVADMLDMFISDGYGILLVSGRPIDACGIATEDWLSRHNIRYDHLFMRASGDNREDTIIKGEIADLLPLDKVDYVLDDRNSVVKMWRSRGLFTLQVSDGAF